MNPESLGIDLEEEEYDTNAPHSSLATRISVSFLENLGVLGKETLFMLPLHYGNGGASRVAPPEAADCLDSFGRLPRLQQLLDLVHRPGTFEVRCVRLSCSRYQEVVG